ncbi:glycosyltransferase family 4 protein [Pengzhenrongella sp.]|jgi:glycosyltransferase involved in cell wall biosynthesis|uniref:glycosyltransferase family 4 protein n=1 Tax=Pengzhenrongella sp. TaxID=2888820 RepID=UPI002F93204A
MSQARSWLLIAAAADRYGADAMLVYVADHLRSSHVPVRVVLPQDGPLRALIVERGIPHLVSPTLVVRKRLKAPAFLLGEVARTPGRILAHLRLLARTPGGGVYVNTVTVPLWAVLARAMRRKTVIHVHEILGGGSFAAVAVRKALYLQLFAAHRIICVSDAVRRDVVSAWPRLADRAVTLLNADFEEAERAEPISTSGGARDLVVVGRLSPRKGQHLVLEAVLGMPDGERPTVALVGTVFPGYEWYEDDLRRTAGEAGLEVDFLGYLPKDEGFARGAIVVVPSTAPDPAPLVVIEALARGCLVIAARTGGIPELLGSEGFLFERGDADSLRECLERALALSAAENRDLRLSALVRAGVLSASAYWKSLDSVLSGLGR